MVGTHAPKKKPPPQGRAAHRITALPPTKHTESTYKGQNPPEATATPEPSTHAGHPHYRSPRQIRETIAKARKAAIAAIKDKGGISDRIAVTIRKPRRKRERDALGHYCRCSWFGGTARISISSEIWRHVSEREDEFSPPFHEALEEAIFETILHEYGHAIAEYARNRNQPLHRHILRHYDDEEEFAEDFMRYFSPRHWMLPMESRFFMSVCARYRLALCALEELAA